MPRVTKLDTEIETFVKHLMAQLDEIEKGMRRSKKVLHLPNPSGKLVQMGKKIGAWHYANISIYLAHLDELYLRVSLYGDLALKNKTANNLAGRIARRAGNLSDDVSTAVIVHIGIEAHHFIPQTLLKDWPFLGTVFPDPNIMPAVNLTKLEHRGNLKLMEKLRNAEDPLPGILGKLPPGQRLESVTTAINEVVERIRNKYPGPLPIEQERSATLELLDEIEKVYDNRFPGFLEKARDLQGDSAWTMKKWFAKTRNNIATVPMRL